MSCPNCGYCSHCGRSNWHWPNVITNAPAPVWYWTAPGANACAGNITGFTYTTPSATTTKEK